MTNYIFNTTPNSTIGAFGVNAAEAGIWMGGGGMGVDDHTNLFFEVGNGSFNVFNNSAGTEYGDCFIKAFNLQRAGSRGLFYSLQSDQPGAE